MCLVRYILWGLTANYMRVSYQHQIITNRTTRELPSHSSSMNTLLPFLSCMRTFMRRLRSGPPSLFSSLASFWRTLTYHSCCILVRPIYNFVSFFGGSEVATSFLTRRSMNGRRTVWSLLITFCFLVSSERLNHASNSSASWKTSGIKKFKSAHNSLKLFCNGVPVISKRNWVLTVRTATLRDDFSFLIRWAIWTANSRVDLIICQRYRQSIRVREIIPRIIDSLTRPAASIYLTFVNDQVFPLDFRKSALLF